MLKAILKKLSILLVLCMAAGVLFCIPAQAAATLTISQPDDWENISKSDPPLLKWNSVTGAAGYRVTVKDYESGDYYAQNEWTSQNSYSLEDLFDTLDSDNYPTLKIWVGAMASSSDPGSAAFADDIIYAIVAEAPDVSIYAADNITSNSATLNMSVDRDYGSAIEDSGFYLGTSSSTSQMSKYSFDDYGSFSPSSKGDKYMTISGLEPGTKYYFRAYAKNGVDETVTSYKTFYTEEDTASGLKLSAESFSLAWNSTAVQTITVSGVSSYTYEVSYAGISSDDKASFDYEWLKVTKSGNALTIQPTRPNYYGSARIATVTVTGGGLSKFVDVTQAACSEAAPAITAKAGTPGALQTIANGSHFGEFLNTGSDVFYLNVDTVGVRKVTVNLWKSGGSKELVSEDYLLDGSSQVTACHQNIETTFTPGEYYVDIYASNSNVPNDYWARRPASIRIYFTVKAESAGGGGSTVDPVTGPGAERIVRIAESQVKKSKTDLGIMDDDWCAAFVAYCADQAGLSGDDNLFISKGSIKVDGLSIPTRKNANPLVLLNNGKADVYYFYNSYGTGGNWVSSNPSWPGKDYEFFLTGFESIYDTSRTQCKPQPGDLIFFKGSSANNPWAHVGIITSVDNATGYLEYVDGNTHGNGTWIEGDRDYSYNYPVGKSDCVNKQYIQNWADATHKASKPIMAIAHPYYEDEETEINPEPQDPTVVESFTVEYNANGGTGAPETQIVKKDTEITLSTQKPTRNGYTFQGWATTASATTATYQPGDKYTVRGKVIFYAVWKQESAPDHSSTLMIITEPSNVTVPVGATAKVTVEATGEGLQYQWYYKNAGSSSFAKSSQTTNSYSVTMSDTVDGRQVYCKITDQNGASVTSVTVTLKMAVSLAITTQPNNVTVPLGETAKVTVKAIGEGLKYQWYYKNYGTSSFAKSSQTTNTYSVQMSDSVSGRQLYCKITDKYNNSVTTNTVTIKKATTLAITTQPKSVTVPVGETAKATIKATGEGLTYQWFVKMPGSSSYAKGSQTGTTYSVTMTEARAGMKICCKVTDKYGKSITSNVATLNKATTLAITQQPKSVTVPIGSTAKTTIKATGEGLKYQWYVKMPGSSSYVKGSQTGTTYSVTMTEARAGMKICCKVTDKYGKSVTSNVATLNKATTLAITQQPASVTVPIGSTAKATIKANGDGLTYQWYVKMPGSYSYAKSSQTGTTYSVQMTAARAGMRICCKVTDKYGKSITSEVATLNKATALAITTQPKSVTVPVGETAKVTIKATGDGLTYQWYVKMPGSSSYAKSSQTGTTYSVQMTEARAGMQICCKVTDRNGNSITSQVATLRKI